MDHRPAIHRSSIPHSWSQPYPHSAPPNSGHPRPLTVPYPPHDPHDVYTAPALYPTVVSQQLPPLPSTLIPGGARPRAKSTNGNDNLFETPPPVPQFPSFPSPSPVQFPQSHLFPPIPVPPSKPPVLRPQLSSYPFPVARPSQNELPIRPPPMSARRSSSSPAIGRITASDLPPPLPPLPSNYYPQHSPRRVSPAPPPLPPPPIPIPSLNQPYRPDSSPFYPSPFETVVPPSFPSRIPSPHRIPTSSSPKIENGVEHAPVDEDERNLAFVIALSEKESKEHSVKVSKEEEDLARAIEESMRHTPSFGMPVPYADAGPSTVPSTASSLSFPIPLPVSESPASSYMSLPSESLRPSASRPASKASSPLMYPVQPSIDDDQALAQWLAEEEERAAVAGPSNPRPKPPILPPPRPEVTTTPAPAPAPAPAPSPTLRKRHDVHRQKLSVVDSEPPPPLYHHVISTQTSAPAKTSPISPNNSPPLGRSSTASAVFPSSSRLSPIPGKDEKSNGRRCQSWDTGSTTSSSSSSMLNPSVSTKPNSLQTVDESLDAPPSASPSAPVTLSPPTANSFIDKQLLDGVCKSFDTAQKHWSYG